MSLAVRERERERERDRQTDRQTGVPAVATYSSSPLTILQALALCSVQFFFECLTPRSLTGNPTYPSKGKASASGLRLPKDPAGQTKCLVAVSQACCSRYTESLPTVYMTSSIWSPTCPAQGEHLHSSTANQEKPFKWWLFLFGKLRCRNKQT